MKILYLADYQGTDLIRARRLGRNLSSGGSTKISRIARALQSAGNQVYILAAGIVGERTGRWFRSMGGVVDASDVPVHYEHTFDVPVVNHVLWIMQTIWWVTRHGKWDAVIVYNLGVPRTVVAAFCIKVLRIPVFIEYEDDCTISINGINRLHEIRGKCCIRALDGNIHGVLGVNTTLTRQFSTPNKLVLPGIVEDNCTSALKSFTGFHAPTLVYAGGLAFLKGVDLLIDALQFVTEPVNLHVYGNGPLYSNLKAKASSSGIHSIWIHGHVSRADLDIGMAEADVFLNPHRMHLGHEQSLFPFKVFEYIAAGRPVISSELPGLDTDLKCGMVMYAEDTAESLAAAIRVWLENREQFAVGARSASAHVKGRYSISAVSGTIDKWLRKDVDSAA